MIKAILHINEDNSKMKSRTSKEGQIVFGKTILNILKDTIKQNGEIIDRSSITGSEDHVIYFMGNAPLLTLEMIESNIRQYPDDIIFFKDVNEAPVALYIDSKTLSKNIDVLQEDWLSFSDLLTTLELSYRVETLENCLCVFTKHDVNKVMTIVQKHINYKLVEEGVSFIDASSTYIDFDVEIGMDTVVYPNTFLTKGTKIGENCIIGPDARIQASIIGFDTTVKDSTILESDIQNHTSVGPYAYIRPNSKVGSNVKVGDFVEIKNATIDDGTKISHLSYVGDADLGKNVNIGCGVVFVNYNGKDKNRSTVKDNAFIGCNSNLVSPVTVEELAYVAAGTTVTKNVPAGALAVGRVKQSNKEGWVERKNLISKK